MFHRVTSKCISIMNLISFILLILGMAPHTRGLELTFDLSAGTTTGYRHVCGVLTCEETYASGTHNTTTELASVQRNITSLRVHRITENLGTSEGSTSENLKGLVAALTMQTSRISRVSDGIKIDGSLHKRRAALRLEMVKEVDCSAQYSCEVRTLDAQGVELVQRVRLRQNPKQMERRDTDTPTASQKHCPHLTSYQQQMTLMLTAFRALETRMDVIQNRLEDKIETRVVDKLSHLEIKMAADKKEEDDGQKYFITKKLDNVLEDLESYTKQLKVESQKAVRLNALIVSNSTLKIESALQAQASKILKKEQKFQDDFNTFISANHNTGNSSIKSSQGTIISCSGLEATFEKLKTDLLNISTETLSAVHDLVSDNNTSMYTIIKSSLVNILSPQECKREMFPSMLGTVFPYHVIEHNGKNLQPGVPYLCDSVTEGGGWIVIQRRVSGSLNFYRNWAQYKRGFGSLYGDFWWGNDNIHELTHSGGTFELRIDLKYQGKASYAHYSSFSIDGENNNYVLRLGKYDGTASDYLSWHNGKPFSTHDRDNDGVTQNHAVDYSGAWWYGNGYHSNLNALWATSGNKAAKWPGLSGINSVTFSEMKIRKS